MMKKALLLLILLNVKICFGQQGVVFDDTVANYLMTFETYPELYFEQASPTTDIWQIGTPVKLGFTNAFQGQKALVTDTANSYPANNHSWFDLKLSLWAAGYPFIGIEFMQKFDTDTLKDGGYITVSYDQGITWYNIIEDTSGNSISPATDWTSDFHQNLYTKSDTLFDGNYGYSGTTNEWQVVKFAWFHMVTNQPKGSEDMIVRFNFISDQDDNHHDGWMIDNLRVYTLDLGGSISEPKSANHLLVYPNPVNEMSMIKTNNNQRIKNLTIYDVQGMLIQTVKVDQSSCSLGQFDLKTGFYLVKCQFDSGEMEVISIFEP